MKKNANLNKKRNKKETTAAAQPRWLAVVKETLMLVLLLAFFFFLKSNTIELFKIPTGSMEKTLYGANDMGHGFGDHILVLRCAYGLSSRIKIPLLDWHVPLPKYRLMLPGTHRPRVGEVVVFENPTDSRIDYIKRCAGTPGDRLRIENGRLYVNDEIATNSPATASYVRYTNAGLLCDRFMPVKRTVDGIVEYALITAVKTNEHLRNELFTAAARRGGNSARRLAIAMQRGCDIFGQFKELYPTFESIIKRGRLDKIKDSVMINGRPYREVEREVARKAAGFDPVRDTIRSEVVVPPDQFFMLGDNSSASKDSRYWGFAPLELVKGKAWCIYLPIKRIRMIR